MEGLWGLVPPQFQPYIGVAAGLVTLASALANVVPPYTILGKVLHFIALNVSIQPPKSQPVLVPPPPPS